MWGILGALGATLGGGLLEGLGTRLGSKLFGVTDVVTGGGTQFIPLSRQLMTEGMYSAAGYTGPQAAQAAQLALRQPGVSASSLLAAETTRAEAAGLRRAAAQASENAMRGLRGIAGELARGARLAGSLGGSPAAIAAAQRQAMSDYTRAMQQLSGESAQRMATARAQGAQLMGQYSNILDQSRQTTFATEKQPYLVQMHSGPWSLISQGMHTTALGFTNPFQGIASLLGMLSGDWTQRALEFSPHNMGEAYAFQQPRGER